ncbi:putative Zn-dependent hydrolase of the beta-lactamase fold [Sulfitobacter guttiformis KCTC 32187]|uniref:L-ascorbate metabolism protein UlaG (Beta-lactamase superfamily) n=2 Tax=Sulfitobacter guttiformis TaxID=74349 RepID=A0A420DPE9_9RHOB|nr:MBL fold metallo-hydrolase [Sulfitobacter guttiformis]KIN73372.1 putative Zn-dependent hydrolase of the beta-lactamase fold [Sulfitobacter guttiformis KCTC 32187]RKE96037.1 L-ascorbate metabolism protein UlaG (beta-lactamase superfamily) [Sulfitobacter guttiformis]
MVGTVQAQNAAATRIPSHCHALAGATQGMEYVHRAALRTVPEEAVDLHYVGHASFLIRSAGGLNIVTDFTGFIGSTRMIPDVVTMNHAHDTHWTAFPDPAIPHVLPGWGEFGEGVQHRLDLGEVLVRNVSTDIRSQFSGIEENGNSIFVFEMAGLCIGHLGHLHHAPNDEQYAAIGRLDVVMAPVDGGYTLDQPTMISVLKRLRSRIVIPMHWFSLFALDDFLDGMRDEFAVVEVEGGMLSVRRDSLPGQPTIMVLRPTYISED